MARSSLAGGLGVHVETGWTRAQWFTESAGGILVSTAAEDAAAFARLVPQARPIGLVSAGDSLEIDGEVASKEALLDAYRRHESGKISQ